MLIFQHGLISEQLKGLYESFLALGSFVNFYYSSDETSMKFLNICKIIANHINNFEADIRKNVAMTESLLLDSDIVRTIKFSINKNQYAIIKPLENQIKVLNKEITDLKIKNQKVTEKSDALELRIFNFTSEIERHRRNTRLSLIFSDPTEQLCGLCQKVFKPSLNFSWSCKHHKAKIINNLWFCCGKTGSDAEGCLVTKHVSIEEIEEIAKDSEKYMYCTVFFI